MRYPHHPWRAHAGDVWASGLRPNQNTWQKHLEVGAVTAGNCTIFAMQIGILLSGKLSHSDLDNMTITIRNFGKSAKCPFGQFSFSRTVRLVVWTHLKNISQSGCLFPIYGQIKHVPNHQPVLLHQKVTERSNALCPWTTQGLSQPSSDLTSAFEHGAEGP